MRYMHCAYYVAVRTYVHSAVSLYVCTWAITHDQWLLEWFKTVEADLDLYPLTGTGGAKLTVPLCTYVYYNDMLL